MDYRNEFLAKNAHYIRSAAARTLHHYVSYQDDEWSVALLAFNEAIDSFSPEKGSFKALADTVISRRLTDELRRSYRHSQETPVKLTLLEGGDEGEDSPDGIEVEVQKKVARDSMESYSSPKDQAREEIEEVQKILSSYGFSFFDLADSSPKAQKTKIECAKAVRAVMESPGLLEIMRQRKQLPVEAIIQGSGVKKKILERHRKYIIAAIEILSGEYPLLAEYMRYIRETIPI